MQQQAIDKEDERFEQQAAARLAQKQEQAEKERKCLLETTPLPPPMTENSDLEQFITTLEAALKKRETPKELWAPTLVPKLNDTLRTVALNLDPEEQADYSTLTQALRDHTDSGAHTPRHSFYTEFKAKGTTIHDH